MELQVVFQLRDLRVETVDRVRKHVDQSQCRRHVTRFMKVYKSTNLHSAVHRVWDTTSAFTGTASFRWKTVHMGVRKILHEKPEKVLLVQPADKYI